LLIECELAGWQPRLTGFTDVVLERSCPAHEYAPRRTHGACGVPCQTHTIRSSEKPEARLQNCMYVFSGVPGEVRTALRGSQEMGEMSSPRFIDAARAYSVQTIYGACSRLCYHAHVIEHTQPKASDEAFQGSTPTVTPGQLQKRRGTH